jgi:nucleotide-binding universal stress UspA family protein
MTILFAYDGSESADAAIASAGRMLRQADADAVVLCVWEPLVVEALYASKFTGGLLSGVDTAEADERSAQEARRAAEHGARLAVEHGFHARPVSIADQREIPEAIVAAADELDADLIVVGARGLTGARATLGSVSNKVAQHAGRPVLVVPHVDATAS